MNVSDCERWTQRMLPGGLTLFFKTAQREAVYTSWFSPTLQHELREPSVELRFVLDHIFTIESLIRNKQACRVPGDVQCVSNSRPTDYTGPVRISVVRNHLQFLAVITFEHHRPVWARHFCRNSVG